MSRLREKTKNKHTLSEWVKMAENITKNRLDKQMPPEQWLMNKGFAGLNYALQDHPEAFAHINTMFLPPPPKRELKIRYETVEEAVAEAEFIAMNRPDRKLPWIPWLRENGYGAIAKAIVENREHFRHLKRAII